MITSPSFNASQTASYLSDRVRLDERFGGATQLVATEAISADEIIAVRSGNIVHRNDLASLPGHLQKIAMRIDRELFLAPADANDPAWAISHSCEPNCGIRGQLAFVALRDIMPGERLTFDLAMLGSPVHNEACDCGAIACRGTLTETDHMSLELRERYRGYFSAWLAKQHDSPEEDTTFLNRFNATGAWGLVTALDLHDCDPATIRSAEKIHQFTVEVCDRIKVNRYGDPIIVHFGAEEKVAGYSLVQLIETSLVSGHFANLTNRAYIDVFSCAWYSPSEITNYASEFFGARSYRVSTYLRH